MRSVHNLHSSSHTTWRVVGKVCRSADNGCEWDMGGHGYSVVRATSSSLVVDFVCIPRPLEPAGRPDGGPLLYRVRNRVEVWSAQGRPQMSTVVIEGDPRFSL